MAKVTKQQKRETKKKKDLHLIYTNPREPGSFSGVQALKRYTGQSVKSIKKYLSGIDAYTIHKPRRLKFDRRKTYSKGIGDLFQADLADVSSLASSNDGHRFILVCIDVFSKRAWAIPIRSKSGENTSAAFEQILQEQKPNMLQTDKGREFRNNIFQNMLKRHDIHYYTSNNPDLKASVAERFVRTIKEKLHRYFTHANTRRYVDVLPDLLHSYNNSHHRSIGMAPSEVGSHNEQLVRERLYPPKPRRVKFKFNVNDKVRISMERRPFQKGYIGDWSEEIFRVNTRLPTDPVTYELKDLSGEVLEGRFYNEELQHVRKSTKGTFKVDEILKTRRTPDGKIEYLVSWKGYPAKFNSWVKELTAI